VSYETIIYKKEEHVARIIINRPEKMNAISMLMVREIMSALEDAEADDHMGVVVISGAGEKAFSAGDDVRDPEWLETGYNWNPGDMYAGLRRKHFYRLLEVIRGMMKPVIAAVNGWCLGSAPELALACDIIIASDTAKFGVPLVNLGVTSTTAILPKVIGYHKACALLFTGEPIDAKQAEAMGMVNHVVPQEQLESTVDELAQKIANQATPIVGWTKWALNKTMGGVSEAIDYEVLAAGLTHPSKYVPSLIERPEQPSPEKE